MLVFLVIFFNFFKLIVEIKLIIFLFFKNINLGIIFSPISGVKARIIVEDLLIIS